MLDLPVGQSQEQAALIAVENNTAGIITPLRADGTENPSETQSLSKNTHLDIYSAISWTGGLYMGRKVRIVYFKALA